MCVWIAVVFYIFGSKGKKFRVYICVRTSLYFQYVTLTDIKAITTVKVNVHSCSLNVNLSYSCTISTPVSILILYIYQSLNLFIFLSLPSGFWHQFPSLSLSLPHPLSLANKWCWLSRQLADRLRHLNLLLYHASSLLSLHFSYFGPFLTLSFSAFSGLMIPCAHCSSCCLLYIVDYNSSL